MIPRPLLGLIVALLVTSCALSTRETLPKLVPAPDPTKSRQQCAAVFPRDRWQMVHAIAFRMADGSKGNALGVLVLDDRKIRCALMTVEGLTLFEARATGEETPEVLRALPPFDNRDFATGLMRDVRTIFQPPPGVVQYGTLANGTPVCRYARGPGVTDILPQADGCWQIQTFDDQTNLRTINARSCRPVESEVLPHFLELTAAGPAGYTLNLRLISAERLPALL